MALKNLAVHLAEIVGWPDIVLICQDLIFADGPYTPSEVADANDLVALVDKMAAIRTNCNTKRNRSPIQ
jgi:hypothetical protein